MMSTDRKNLPANRLTNEELSFLDRTENEECKRIASFFRNIEIDDALKAAGWEHKDGIKMLVEIMETGTDTARLNAFGILRKIVRENEELGGGIVNGHATHTGKDQHGNHFSQTVSRSALVAGPESRGYTENDSAGPLIQHALSTQSETQEEVVRKARIEKERREIAQQNIRAASGVDVPESARIVRENPGPDGPGVEGD